MIDSLLRELQRQTESVRAGHAALDLPQSVIEVPEPPKNMIVYSFFQHGYVVARRQEKKNWRRISSTQLRK